jgi:hypothetical protein
MSIGRVYRIRSKIGVMILLVSAVLSRMIRLRALVSANLILAAGNRGNGISECSERTGCVAGAERRHVTCAGRKAAMAIRRSNGIRSEISVMILLVSAVLSRMVRLCARVPRAELALASELAAPYGRECALCWASIRELTRLKLSGSDPLLAVRRLYRSA